MGIWKDKIRKDWRYSFERRKIFHAGGGYKTRREAATAREERRKTVNAETAPAPLVMGFREVALNYLDYSERKHATSTYKYKKSIYKSFFDHHGNLPIEGITPQHIDEYCSTRPTAHNYNVHRKELSCLFAYAKKHMRLDIHNPCAYLEKMAEDKTSKQIPSDDEIRKMISVLAPGDEHDIFMCCLHLAGRIDEVLRLKWNDINFPGRTITIYTRKRKGGGLEADTLPMSDELWTILRTRQHESETWVFYNRDTGGRFMHRPKMMASICKRAGIKPIGKGIRKLYRGKKKGETEEINLYYGFHVLRHVAATYLVINTDLLTAQAYLRHKDIKTTQVYLHKSDQNLIDAAAQIGANFTSKKTKPQASPASMIS